MEIQTILIFIVLSIVVTWLSWRTIFDANTHGFYRYFAWEAMSWIFAVNYRYWFLNPFSVPQMFSWLLLFVSAYLVIAGYLLIRYKGRPNPERPESNLFGFEKTTQLVDTGVYRFIRHPLYASLIYVTWGLYLKHPDWPLFVLSVFSTLMLYITSRFDEKECIAYFGKKYTEYMKHTKMFIPFLF